MTQPAQPAHTHTVGTVSVSRILMFIAAVCFFLAAITECGVAVLSAPALAWAFGGFSAWCLAAVI